MVFFFSVSGAGAVYMLLLLLLPLMPEREGNIFDGARLFTISCTSTSSARPPRPSAHQRQPVRLVDCRAD